MKTITMMTLLLAVSALAQAQNSTLFSHTLTTKAPTGSVWDIWTDVPNWHTWDTGLRSAEIEGALTLGAKGSLRPDKGPKAKFRITDFEEGKGYTFATAIPFGKLYVARRLEEQDGKTAFTHEVWFTGLLRGVFSRSMGKRYAKMLPEAMEKIREQAEAHVAGH